MSVEVLSGRALNRATLARQLLLRRSEMPALDAVERLVGLQAQVPLNPYTGLWSRLARFRPESLGRLLEERRAVRIVLMRATIHLVSADDCLLLRPLVQPVLDAELARHPEHGRRCAGSTSIRSSPPPAPCSRSVRAPAPSCAPPWPSAFAASTPPRWPTPAATCWHWSKSRPGACGAAPPR